MGLLRPRRDCGGVATTTAAATGSTQRDACRAAAWSLFCVLAFSQPDFLTNIQFATCHLRHATRDTRAESSRVIPFGFVSFRFAAFRLLVLPHRLAERFPRRAVRSRFACVPVTLRQRTACRDAVAAAAAAAAACM